MWSFIKKYGPTVVSLGSGVIGILNPALVAAHPQIVAAYLAGLATLNHWLQSPVAPAQTK